MIWPNLTISIFLLPVSTAPSEHANKCLNLHPSVLHPALRLSWFKSINNDSYERAKDVFAYHFHEYEANAPVSTPQPTPGPQPTTSNSFLANIARRSSSVLVTAPKPASEFDQFAIYEHGKDEVLALEHPLLWWKVCYSSHYCTCCYLLFLL
jgi:hypothetical protein